MDNNLVEAVGSSVAKQMRKLALNLTTKSNRRIKI